MRPADKEAPVAGPVVRSYRPEASGIHSVGGGVCLRVNRAAVVKIVATHRPSGASLRCGGLRFLPGGAGHVQVARGSGPRRRLTATAASTATRATAPTTVKATNTPARYPGGIGR